MIKRLFILLYISAGISASAQDNWTNVVTSEADRTGKIRCTGIVNKLIDMLSAEGGGTLYFPGGTFLTGPITLRLI